MERAVLDAEGMEGLVLRYGWFYGPGTYYANDGPMAADVRRRRFPVVGEAAECSRSSTSSSAALPVSTTSSTTIRRRCASGCRPTRGPSAPAAQARAALARPPDRRWLRGDDEHHAGRRLERQGKSELNWAPRWISWREGFRDAPR
jgi:hypothetical protein